MQLRNENAALFVTFAWLASTSLWTRSGFGVKFFWLRPSLVWTTWSHLLHTIFCEFLFFHFSLFIFTWTSQAFIEHLRDTKKAVHDKLLNRSSVTNQFIYFKTARKIKQRQCSKTKRKTESILVNNYTGASQRPQGVQLFINTLNTQKIRPYRGLFRRGGVEDTRLEAKAKDTKKSEAKDSLSEDKTFRGQGQECSRLRPRTEDTGTSVLLKKRSAKIFLRRSPIHWRTQNFWLKKA